MEKRSSIVGRERKKESEVEGERERKKTLRERDVDRE